MSSGKCRPSCLGLNVLTHDDVIKWKHFLRYWPFVRGIHRSPVNSPHKGQWRGALMFTLIFARINGWVNNREAGDLRRNRTHYDVIVMKGQVLRKAFPCRHAVTHHKNVEWLWTNCTLMEIDDHANLLAINLSIEFRSGAKINYRHLFLNVIATTFKIIHGNQFWRYFEKETTGWLFGRQVHYNCQLFTMKSTMCLRWV